MAGSLGNDTILNMVAARRGGICLRHELLAAGLSPDAIKRRLSAGALISVGRGVYLVQALRNETTPSHRAQALLPSGLVCHESAGRFESLAVDPATYERPIDMMVPADVNHRPTGITLHRRRRMPDPSDVIEIEGLRMTAPHRTIVDLAAVVGRARLTHIVHTALRDRATTIEALVGCFDSVARRGVTGIAALRAVLLPLVDAEPIPQSALERVTAEFLEQYGLVGFHRQYRPPWFDGVRGTVDFAHPDLKVVLEADGMRWHSRPGDLAEDRRRDRLAAANGWTTIRVTWMEITQRPAAVAAEIRSILKASSTAA